MLIICVAGGLGAPALSSKTRKKPMLAIVYTVCTTMYRLKELRIHFKKCTCILVIVALSG
jgi:hypothetical protein